MADPWLTVMERNAVGRALRTAYFDARRREDAEAAAALFVAAGKLGLRDYVPHGAALIAVTRET